jgi:hypothetical protein
MSDSNETRRGSNPVRDRRRRDSRAARGRDPEVLASDAAAIEEGFEAGSNNRFIAGLTRAVEVDVDVAKIRIFDAASDCFEGRLAMEGAQPVKTDFCKVQDTKSTTDVWISP